MIHDRDGYPDPDPAYPRDWFTEPRQAGVCPLCGWSGDLVEHFRGEQVVFPVASRPPRRRPRWGRIGLLLAIAAGWLLAAGVALWVAANVR